MLSITNAWTWVVLEEQVVSVNTYMTCTTERYGCCAIDRNELKNFHFLSLFLLLTPTQENYYALLWTSMGYQNNMLHGSWIRISQFSEYLACTFTYWSICDEIFNNKTLEFCYHFSAENLTKNSEFETLVKIPIKYYI